MIKLSDAQLVVLSAACQRPGRNVLPLPERMKGGAAQKIVSSLLAKALIEEAPAAAGEPVWREGADHSRTTLRATDAAFQALGIEPEDGAGETAGETSEPGMLAVADRQANTPAEGDEAKAAPTAHERADTPTQAATGGDGAEAGASEPTPDEAAPTSAPRLVRKSRADTKQAQLVAMLQRPEGASLDEIVAATSWQPHTVRGAIAGALKKKLGLTVTSEKVEGRGRVYRVAG